MRGRRSLIKLNHIEKKNNSQLRFESISVALETIESDDWFASYIETITPLIDTLYGRKCKPYVHEPTIFGDNSKENVALLEVAFKQRQMHMKEGELTQILIGNWVGWEDLGVGHPTGLDCRKKDNSIIMDVKNKFNTCNSGSQKALFDKLAKYRATNPNTRCLWAIVNSKPGSRTLSETIAYEGHELEKIQGVELFKLVFTVDGTDYSPRVIRTVQSLLRKYH